jgi:hypothetical protein
MQGTGAMAGGEIPGQRGIRSARASESAPAGTAIQWTCIGIRQ